MKWGVFLVAALLAAGCYRSTTRSGAGLRDAGPRDAPTLPLDVPIPLRRDAPFVRPDVPVTTSPLTPCDGAGGLGASGFDVRCGTLEMRLDRDGADARTLDVYVEAVEPFEPVRAQLWMLQGGPGGSTTFDFEPFATVLQPEIPGLEVLLIDHRGTGRSSRIVCPGEDIGTELGTAMTEDEWSECVDLLDAIRDRSLHYSTTEAARDLGEAIEILRRPGVPVYVYGVSYGTYWAHRWLQLFPEQADGVVLDSICSPTECSFPIDFARTFDRVGRDVLSRCGADPFCRSQVGADPATRMATAVATFEAGGCAAASRAGFTAHELRMMAASLISDPTFRNALPALALRASRCADGDEAAFATLHSVFATPVPGDEWSFEGFSLPLYAIVSRSELWDLPATEAEEDALERTLIAYAPFQPDAFEAWSRVPHYDPGPLWSEIARTSVPVMLWQGELDPQTSVEDAAPLRAALSGPFQTYVELPRATHGILARRGTDALSDCGIRMMAGFVANPRAPVDASCADQEPPLDFADETLAMAVFGTSTLYGFSLEPHTHALSLRDLELRERLRELVHRGPRFGPP